MYFQLLNRFADFALQSSFKVNSHFPLTQYGKILFESNFWIKGKMELEHNRVKILTSLKAGHFMILYFLIQALCVIKVKKKVFLTSNTSLFRA